MVESQAMTRLVRSRECAHEVRLDAVTLPRHGKMKEAIMAYNNQGQRVLIAPPAAGAPQPGRRTYQAKRRAQLEHIRTLDVKHREFIVWLNPQGNREGDDESWLRDDLSRADRSEIEKADHELWLSHRVLAHAVEGYLLGCVELSSTTGESVLRQATSTEDLIARLQAEEDLMISRFGPPWGE
jgi:hypothetical protein